MTDLFASAEAQRLELPDAELVFYRNPDFGRPAQDWFDTLREAVAWREEPIRMYGKTYLQPRLLAWYGDADAVYRYSGKRYDPQPWLPPLQELRERVEALAGAAFNSVLANLYRDHRDRMGLHADDEPELGPRPVIASLSLGEERVFRMRHRFRKDLKPLRLPLPSGSLLIMRGDTQTFWKHEVPRQSQPCGPRINLTFRFIRAAVAPPAR